MTPTTNAPRRERMTAELWDELKFRKDSDLRTASEMFEDDARAGEDEDGEKERQKWDSYRDFLWRGGDEPDWAQ